MLEEEKLSKIIEKLVSKGYNRLGAMLLVSRKYKKKDG